MNKGKWMVSCKIHLLTEYIYTHLYFLLYTRLCNISCESYGCLAESTTRANKAQRISHSVTQTENIFKYPVVERQKQRHLFPFRGQCDIITLTSPILVHNGRALLKVFFLINDRIIWDQWACGTTILLQTELV